VEACSRRSSSHARRVFDSGASTSCSTARIWLTALVVPWRTRVGEWAPSGVMKDWHSCDSGAIGSCCSEVKSHLGSHLLTPVTRLYTQHTNRHPEVASSNTMGEGDGCKGKLELEKRES
jgi:hypothetical protein